MIISLSNSSFEAPARVLTSNAWWRVHGCIQQSPLRLQGTAATFLDCVFVRDADYTTNKARKTGFLIYWALQYTWVGGAFELLIAYGMFDRKFFRWWEVTFIGCSAILIFVLTIAGAYSKGWAADKVLVQLLVPGEQFRANEIEKLAFCQFSSTTACCNRCDLASD